MLPTPAGREASPGGGAPPYVRHRPECTLLYQLVEEYYPVFKVHLATQGTTCRDMKSRSSRTTSNVGVSSPVFCEFAATPAMPST